MAFNWVWYIAGRYIFRKQKKSPSPALSILGIATGVFALVVILAVMNGFQLSFIESILEISSYHLRIQLPSEMSAEKTEAARKELLAVPGVEAAVPFREFQGLVRGRRSGQQAALVRGLPANALSLDAAMAGRLVFEDGSFDLEDANHILLGVELARRLGTRIGDTVTLFSIPAIFATVGGAATVGSDTGENAGSQTFTIAGLFRTGFYEYDTTWAFAGIESAGAFSDTGPVIGVKLKNRFHDRQMLELARKSLENQTLFEDMEFSSWRDYNRSFFGALRTEKLFMFILVGLIFIVVGLNIYQAQRRIVLEHREEIGLLRAIGGGERAVRLIFVCDGAIIGFAGASAGLCLGLLIASNIPMFFTAIETIVNFIIKIVNIIVHLFNFGGDTGGIGGFSFFSPAIFYIKEIPSRIIPREAVLIYIFGFFSALLAAWFASRKVSKIQPAEVLRYE